MRRTYYSALLAMAALAAAVPAAAQTAAPAPAQSQPALASPNAGAVAAPASTPLAPPPTVTAGVKPPADYVIGVDDALDIVYWQDKDMSSSVVVRPDGNISLPLLNDIHAAGLTPEELRTTIATAATKFVEDPTVSVVVKAINSRRVYIQGQIAKPGTYPLGDTTTILQMLAIAGGVNEYAKAEKITIVRVENGKQTFLRFNYKNVSQGKSLEQNIALKPGDSITVP